MNVRYYSWLSPDLKSEHENISFEENLSMRWGFFLPILIHLNATFFPVENRLTFTDEQKKRVLFPLLHKNGYSVNFSEIFTKPEPFHHFPRLSDCFPMHYR